MPNSIDFHKGFFLDAIPVCIIVQWADSMLDVYQGWDIKKRLCYLYINQNNELKSYLPKNLLLYVYWRKWLGKSRDHLQVRNIWDLDGLHHPTWSNNCKNVTPILILYNVTATVALNEDQSFIAQFSPSIVNWKRRLILQQ